MPRIIAGKARGTRLATLPGQQTRPTADRVKEALFSILAPRLSATGFLDLYAGTGQIGLEAASRGASPVVMVEMAGPCIGVIRANQARTHLADCTELIGSEVAVALARLVAQERRFSVIFLDPPYRIALAEMAKLAGRLAELLSEGGMVVLEHESRQMPPPFVTNLQLARSCQYGTAMLSFYTVDQSAEPGLPRLPSIREKHP